MGLLDYLLLPLWKLRWFAANTISESRAVCFGRTPSIAGATGVYLVPSHIKLPVFIPKRTPAISKAPMGMWSLALIKASQYASSALLSLAMYLAYQASFFKASKASNRVNFTEYLSILRYYQMPAKKATESLYYLVQNSKAVPFQYDGLRHYFRQGGPVLGVPAGGARG